MFYERVGADLTLNAMRLDGIHQKQYVVPDPDFFPIVPSFPGISASLVGQAVRRMDSNLHAPYIMQAAVTYERQLPGNTTMSFTYSNARGVRTLRSRNINAPLSDSRLRPFGPGNIYQYESSGFFRQNQLLLNWNSRVNRRISLLGYYAWGKAFSDSDGAGSFPANSYDITGEYARAGFDVRHRVMVGGNLVAPFGLTFSPLITASSGLPFNVSNRHRSEYRLDIQRPSRLGNQPQPAQRSSHSIRSVRHLSHRGAAHRSAEPRPRAGAGGGQPSRGTVVRVRRGFHRPRGPE